MRKRSDKVLWNLRDEIANLKRILNEAPSLKRTLDDGPVTSTRHALLRAIKELEEDEQEYVHRLYMTT